MRIDVYGNNGVAAGDFDNDGFDDLYVCQPAGLPNRLYRNRGDGTFEDVTEKAGVGVLDNTACALFADFRIGDSRIFWWYAAPARCSSSIRATERSRSSGMPSNSRALRREHSRMPPSRTTIATDVSISISASTSITWASTSITIPFPITTRAMARRIACCTTKAMEHSWRRLERPGLNADNDRYSFACAWGDSNGNGLPDLYVANDFGSSQLYRNNGDGTFTVVSKEAHVETWARA